MAFRAFTGILVMLLVSKGFSPAFGPRVDRFGDPLPDGAIIRLGTLRLTHLGNIQAVAISPDGTLAASGVRDGKSIWVNDRIVHQADGVTISHGERFTLATIRLWKVKTGQLLREITTPDAPVSHIRFAADGKTFFAGCGRYLCCFEIDTGKLVWQRQAITGERFYDGAILERIFQAGDTIASLHGGRIMCPVEISGGASYHYHSQLAVRFWNARTGAPLPLAKALQSTITSKKRVPILLHGVALTPDLKHAAIAVSEAEPSPRDANPLAFGDDKWKYPNSRVEVIDVASGKVLLSIANPDGEFGKLAIATDGSKVAVLTGKTISTPFNENGQTGVRTDTRKDLWFASVDKKEKRILAKGLAWIVNLDFVAPDRLAANDGDGKITVWRLDTGARVDKHEVRADRFLPAQAAGVAVEAWQNTIRLTDVKSGKPLHALPGHRSAPGLRFAIHSPDTLISRNNEGAVFWDTRTWQPKQVLPMPKDSDRYRWYWDGDGEFDYQMSVEKGLYLLKGKQGMELRDLKTQKVVRPLDDKGDHGTYHFSPAGNRIMSQEDGAYGFFDVETGKRLAKAEGDPANVGYMWYRHPEISTHGKFFAKTATDFLPVIQLYDAGTGKFLRGLTPKSFHLETGPRGSILKFKFSPDEQLVFGEVHETVKHDNGFSGERVSLCIWDAQTGEVVQDMVLDPAMWVFWRETLSRSLVGVMAISPDHRLVALARVYGRSYEPREATPIEIWEVASGTKRGELAGHGPIASLAFSPDGRYLASSSDDTTVLIWDLNRRMQPRKRLTQLTEKELAACWKKMFERDAAQAEHAIWSMIECPADSLPYVGRNLRPAPVPDDAHVRKLLTNLDSNDFKTRIAANNELARFGELVLPQLEHALKESDKLESRRRLELLAKTARDASQPYGSLTRVGETRALEVLEAIGNPQAIEILRDVANGSPGSQLTTAARTTLARVQARSKAKR